MMNWAYVAGFFDGEGNIDLSDPRITIVQKPRLVLERISRFLAEEGIKSSIRHRTSQYKNKGLTYGMRDIHSLRINSNAETFKFCKAVRPFLVVKKQPVEDFLRFRTWLPFYTDSQKGKRRWEAAIASGRATNSLANLKQFHRQ